MSEEPGGPISAAELTAAMTPEAIESMHRAFGEMPLHALLGLRMVEWGPNGVTVEMPVREQAFNSTGNLHGGAIATLIDTASGTAAALGSSFVPGVNTIVTADLHVRYLGRPRTDLVRAEARVLKAGRQLVVVETQVLDENDRIIAVADFSAMIVPMRDPLRPLPAARKTDPDL
jgi:uncharacterized protein (TIGR00369 family)